VLHLSDDGTWVEELAAFLPMDGRGIYRLLSLQLQAQQTP
jgi:hypothetical protein